MTPPDAWPVCPEHGTPYVLRRAYSVSKGWIWSWFPDCHTESGKLRRACQNRHPSEVEIHTS